MHSVSEIKMSSNISKNIKAIDKEAVHRICSGQVVLNLATAVKELVENSLDAGATLVDIRLREYGNELIEVSDNGCGVESENFQGLTLKHHTSKLQDFSDLISVETFGFRGEALSSLCALSNLTVITRHGSSECGSRLVFDHNGKITSSTSVARQIGTTVSLENIFSTLPVRQKEFHRNIKREFGKMVQLLYAYCLVSTGVKISCINQTKKGGRTTVVSTQGCKTVRENIACVFGTKQLSSLLEVKEVTPSNEVLEQLNLKDVDVAASVCQLEGMVSSCAHGSGRSTADRQFYYVNSRPCEPTKVTKAVNEVYRQYNMHQQPFVFLNIRSARDSVDVNVTPDKRQVFIEHEKLLVATVKASLQALYEHIPSTYTVNNISAVSPKNTSSPTSLPHSSSSSPLALFSQWRHNGSNKRPSTDQPSEKISKQAKLDIHFMKKDKETDFLKGFAKNSSPTSIQELSSKLGVQNSPTSQDRKSNTEETQQEDKLSSGSKEKTSTEENDVKHFEPIEKIFILQNDCRNHQEDYSVTKIEICPEKNETCEILSQSSSVCETDSIEKQDLKTPSEVNSLSSQTSSMSDFVEDSDQKTYLPLVHLDTSSVKESSGESDVICKNEEEEVPSNPQTNIKYDSEFTTSANNRPSVEVNVTLEDLREYVRKMEEKKNILDEAKVRFRAVIDPSKNQQAEQELSREISKDMFSKMDVIGQFNLGFIIAKLNSDLFIVDQHATDEKYNFETLQKTTTISNQKLVVPQQLELTAVNEAILMDNLNVFKANGFEFTIDETAATTSKVKLTSIPISLNWTFGKEDIDELLFMLQDAPNTLCRPSRVRAMFASRACRKSVMIGTALSKADMKRLLLHMGEIEQPWNCPHGRPTMRHLVNLHFT